MPAKISYQDWQREDLSALIEKIGLPELQKHCLRSRWLDQVLWMEGRANSARNKYYALRLATILGAVITPALVSAAASAQIGPVCRWSAFGVSLLVAASAAVEGFFHFGDRWRHYRRTVEGLKIEGWEFFQLAGSYRRYKTHEEAYPLFAGRVEKIIRADVEVYIAEVAQEGPEESSSPTGTDSPGSG